MKLIFNKYIYSFVFIVLLFAISLPSILHKAGLHPTFDGEVLNLSGKKALIIATNHGILNAPNKIEGKPTGLLLSELSVPYFDFIKSGISTSIPDLIKSK